MLRPALCLVLYHVGTTRNQTVWLGKVLQNGVLEKMDTDSHTERFSMPSVINKRNAKRLLRV